MARRMARKIIKMMELTIKKKYVYIETEQTEERHGPGTLESKQHEQGMEYVGNTW